MVFNEELKREIPLGWEDGTLLDIANFQNGLACQKFRPKENEDSLRVIKIREMGSGFTENSEFVSANIPEKIIITNGDILFSWSATLDVIIWTGGKGALNQHIFKVTSEKYPRSYFYFELLNYLQHFKMQAELRKTTMGHITQEHLKQSRIIIPKTDLINKLDKIIKPILNKKVKLDEENQKLSELRDWLLPMLMNGQVSVGEVENDFKEFDNFKNITKPKKLYKTKEESFQIVAEPKKLYETKKESSISELFNQINLDYEIAAIVWLTEQKLKKNFGKKFIHKMFSNIELLNTLPVIKNLEFQEKGWGMFSRVIAKTIDCNKFLKIEKIGHEQSVLKLDYKYLSEISNWTKKDDAYNKLFVEQVNQMLTVYEDSLIDKNMDRIELLNTVLECIKVLKTYDFESIYKKMKGWEMKEDSNNSKADKFKAEETRLMIELIKGLKNNN